VLYECAAAQKHLPGAGYRPRDVKGELAGWSADGFDQASFYKSLFALVIKISFGCTRDFRVNMWGTSLPDDKLTGDLGNVIGATSIGGRRSDFFTAGKLAPGNLGLLQQYRHIAAQANVAGMSSLAKAEMRASKRGSGFDPLRKSGGQNCCDAQQGCFSTMW
jgi:hypothetical protein